MLISIWNANLNMDMTAGAKRLGGMAGRIGEWNIFWIKYMIFQKDDRKLSLKFLLHVF